MRAPLQVSDERAASDRPVTVGEAAVVASPALARPGAFLAAALHDLAASPSFAWRLFRANLSASRRRALFGYLWLVFPAASATLIAVYLEQRQLIGIGPTVLPYALHVVTGMVLWQTFLDALNMPMTQLAGARGMITRTTAAHEALFLAGFADVLLNTLVRFGGLAIFTVLIGVTPAPGAALMLPAGAAALALLGGAVGLALAPFALLFDDVRRGIALLATFWFFLTPVFYAAPPGGPLGLNPVTPLLESARASIAGSAAGWPFWPVALLSACALVLAWLFQRLARPHVIERLG